MSSKVKIADPVALRQAFYGKGLKTVRNIAAELKMSTRTVSKLFNDQTINIMTIMEIAEYLGVQAHTLIKSDDKPTS